MARIAPCCPDLSGQGRQVESIPFCPEEAEAALTAGVRTAFEFRVFGVVTFVISVQADVGGNVHGYRQAYRRS